MDCSKCSQLLTPYIKGNLDKETSAAVRSHLKLCDACREDYENTKWLIDGMVRTKKEIEAGHLSSMLLYDFVNARESLERETIDMIEAHTRTCNDCAQDLDRIKQLVSLPTTGDGATVRAVPRTSLWDRLLAVRLVPVYAAAAALIVVLSVVYFFGREPSTSFVAQVMTEDAAMQTGHRIVSLLSSQVTRGDEEASQPVQEVSRKGTGYIILGMDVVTFEDEAAIYEIILRPQGGDPVWEGEVETVLLETGRLWLTINTEALSLGNYEVSLYELTPDGYRSTIVSSVFLLVE